VSKFYGLPRENYFCIAMTTDCSNPFSQTQNKPFLPELYHENYGLEKNCWSELSSQFGWINYSRMESIVQSMVEQKGLSKKSLFIDSLELNRTNMRAASSISDKLRHSLAGLTHSEISNAPYRPSAGVSLIYSPELNEHTFLHFSWRGENSALRDYSISNTIQPFEDRRYRASDISKRIKFEKKIPNRKPIWDVKFWHEKVIALNKEKLK